MSLSEKFQKYAKHYYSIAKDPYFIGVAAVFAVCALPVSATASAVSIAAPLAYAGVGAICQLTGHGLHAFER